MPNAPIDAVPLGDAVTTAVPSSAVLFDAAPFSAAPFAAAPGCLRRGGRHLFGFAVIADSHLEPAPSGSPVPRSNQRNRWLVSALAPMRPRFVVHLGDIVHPVPDAAGHRETMAVATALYAGIGAPMFWTPGNHDVGDKTNPMMPAAVVTEEWLGEYGRVFGAPWQVHDFGAGLLILLNTPILNAGSEVERLQRRWLERVLGEARGRRIFMATHYPPYLLSPDEVGHYDNVDPPARGWLLELLRRHRVEALFCGHVHNLFYHRLDGTEIYLLPSPSFVRRDYSELYPVEARNEFGRNDVGKLGCFWVDVYESGHVARLIRTAGRCGTDAGDGASPTARLVVPGHPKDPGEARFGVHLRHPWSPLVELPYTPPVDAFARRVVRNDAPLQALWDLGVRDVRIPVADLADARLVARLEDLVAVGMRITVFSAGLPDAPLLASLASATGLLVRWECVLPWAEAPRLVERAAAVVTESGLEPAIADLRSAAVGNAGRPAGKHFTAPGFLPGETALAEACLDACPPGVIGAVVFRGEQGGIDDTALAAIAAFARARRVRAVVTWTVMPDGPNDAELDPARVEQSIRRLDAAAQRFPELAWMLDDFVDVDRGYYPRVALVDRRAEPNPAGEWMRRGRAGAATAPSTGF